MRTMPPTADARAGASTGVDGLLLVPSRTFASRHCSSYSAVALVQQDNEEHPHAHASDADAVGVTCSVGV
jgi:hypothetical protein